MGFNPWYNKQEKKYTESPDLPLSGNRDGLLEKIGELSSDPCFAQPVNSWVVLGIPAGF